HAGAGAAGAVPGFGQSLQGARRRLASAGDPYSRSSMTMRRVLLVLILLAAVAGAVIWVRGKETAQHAARGGAGAPVPVVLAEAETQNVPVYLDALGTVQAF